MNGKQTAGAGDSDNETTNTTFTHSNVLTSGAKDLSTELSDAELTSVLSALIGDSTDDIFDFLHLVETNNSSSWNVTTSDSICDTITIETDYATYDIPIGRVPEHNLVSPTGADDNCHITVGSVLTLTTPFNTLPQPIQDVTHDAVTHKEADINCGPSSGSVEAVLWTDGASRGNPGPASAGVVLEFSDRENITDKAVFVGELTNNQAEYRALQYGLSIASMSEVENISIRVDSELVVKQLTGEYSVNDDTLADLKKGVEQLLTDISWDITHVPREENAEADKLANEALDKDTDN